MDSSTVRRKAWSLYFAEPFWKLIEVIADCLAYGRHAIACDIISMRTMQVVLDTDVLVAALRSDQGASRQLLLAALDRRFVMLVSVPLMLEYEAVLTRQEHLAAARITAGDVNTVLDALAAVIEPVRLSFLWRPRLKDAADEMVLETAVNGTADRLVTFNVKHLGKPALEFGIRAVNPGEVWRVIAEK